MAYFQTKDGSLEESIRKAVGEKLVGGQKKLDKNKDGKIDGTDLHIFVKKNNDEGRDFYYLGQAELIHGTEREELTKDKNGDDTDIVTMNLELRSEMPLNVYEYFKDTNN